METNNAVIDPRVIHGLAFFGGCVIVAFAIFFFVLFLALLIEEVWWKQWGEDDNKVNPDHADAVEYRRRYALFLAATIILLIISTVFGTALWLL